MLPSRRGDIDLRNLLIALFLSVQLALVPFAADVVSLKIVKDFHTETLRSFPVSHLIFSLPLSPLRSPGGRPLLFT
jgi:hypothetical protein